MRIAGIVDRRAFGNCGPDIVEIGKLLLVKLGQHARLDQAFP